MDFSLTRSTRFQALREKYDQVNLASCRRPSIKLSALTILLNIQKHEEHQRDLETANKRIKMLQAENECVHSTSLCRIFIYHCVTFSLLLDAMNLAVTSQPALAQYASPSQQQHESHSAVPDGHLYASSRSNASPHLNYPNGASNGNGNSNSAPIPHHRPLEVVTVTSGQTQIC
jgi:hypothetical protein